jgi:hypothetical protein
MTVSVGPVASGFADVTSWLLSPADREGDAPASAGRHAGIAEKVLVGAGTGGLIAGGAAALAGSLMGIRGS